MSKSQTTAGRGEMDTVKNITEIKVHWNLVYIQLPDYTVKENLIGHLDSITKEFYNEKDIRMKKA